MKDTLIIHSINNVHWLYYHKSHRLRIVVEVNPMTNLTTTIIIFVVFCKLSVVVQTISIQCPNGKSSTKTCGVGDLCPSDQKCYQTEANNSFCCGELDTFCPTKIHAYNSANDYEVWLWGPGASIKAEHWYNVKLGNATIACPIPSSLTYQRSVDLTVLPVDFDIGKKETSIPEVCNKNSDCNGANNEFCGPVVHPAETNELDKSGKNGVPLHFCYKFQDHGSTKIKPFMKPDEKGLIGCKEDSDCYIPHGSDKVCFQKKYSPVNINDKAGNVNSMFGVCAMVNACDPARHESLSASVSNDNTFCKLNEDCQGAGISKDHPGMEPECVDADGLLTTVDAPKLCCFKHEKRCEFGVIQIPSESCDDFEDCNSDATAEFKNMWCDEKEKYCCRDLHNKLWQCPDRATPLFNEPKCNGYNAANATSGTCPDNTGICKYGHCCPPLKIDNANEGTLGQKPYTTNIDCELDVLVPQQFSYAFCDPVSQKIVILGEQQINGEPVAKYTKKCLLNKQCSEDQVCVILFPGQHNCFHNPMEPVKAAANEVWVTVLLAATVASLICCPSSILCLMCYRSEDFLDQFKRAEEESVEEDTFGVKRSKKKTRGK